MFVSLILVCLFSDVSNAYFNISHNNYHEYFINVVKEELPTKKFIEKAHELLKAVLEFYTVYLNDVDLNMRIGLFIVKVNLMKSRQHNTKYSAKIDELLGINKELLDYFDKMLVKHHESSDILNLFRVQSVWVKRIEKFSLSLTNITHKHTNAQLIRKYSPWSPYLTKIRNLEHHVPSPDLSSRCLVELSKIPPETYEGFVPSCKLDKQCVSAIYRGTDFGHALSYRLLLLQAARYSRGCSVVSPDKDAALSSNLCVKAYNEVQYITAQLGVHMEGYWMIDLMMNFMSHCSLFGHMQFLQLNWIKIFLQHQNEFGCFSATSRVLESPLLGLPPPPDKNTEWVLLKENQQFFDGKCNGYTTSLAAAVLSSVLRMLLEADEYIIS